MDEFEIKYYSIAKDILFRRLDVSQYCIFVFGSRAARRNSKSSDLDIGILGNRPVSKGTLAKIKEELAESMVPYHIDLVDFTEVDNNFKKIALKKVVIWNRPKHIRLS